jgi:hypothetical protein
MLFNALGKNQSNTSFRLGGVEGDKKVILKNPQEVDLESSQQAKVDSKSLPATSAILAVHKLSGTYNMTGVITVRE